MRYRYEVLIPIASTRDIDREGITYTKHRTLAGAVKSLHSHQRGCQNQGGYSNAYIYDYFEDTRIES